ncbi:uncharacterized protein LOC116180786 [Photinus pyralis]|uniref:Pacifastin domain-containing protein n=1 Tax=Photinus pyralis TaxID=7054 RepID=A0A1Y1LS15_PHOPY|nr:uncharacterized protein LOC116180786 [Photinus pyralis]
MVPKVLLIVGLFAFFHLRNGRGENHEDVFECSENGTYVLDGAYPCQCIAQLNNTLNCDLSKCPDEPVIRINCIVGSSWQDGCGKCWCRSIGRVCSYDDCHKEKN